MSQIPGSYQSTYIFYREVPEIQEPLDKYWSQIETQEGGRITINTTGFLELQLKMSPCCDITDISV